MLLCCACGLFGDQRYVCDIDAVESIQIVRLDKYIAEEYRFEYTVLSEVFDLAAFVDRLNNLKHSVNWGDPRTLYEQYTVIRIQYRNGDFDFIHARAQCFNQSGTNQSGYFFFDREQFDKLISDYL